MELNKRYLVMSQLIIILWQFRREDFYTSDENIMATNPNYNLGLSFQLNCQKCVPTYEMRMRGFDVVARPTYDLNTDSFATYYWDKVFKDAVF